MIPCIPSIHANSDTVKSARSSPRFFPEKHSHPIMSNMARTSFDDEAKAIHPRIVPDQLLRARTFGHIATR